MSTEDRSPERYGSMARRWLTPPSFTPIPEDANTEQRLHLRFDPIQPPVGTVDRIQRDRLGLVEPAARPEILAPSETVDGKPIPLGKPAPFADDQKGGEQ